MTRISGLPFPNGLYHRHETRQGREQNFGRLLVVRQCPLRAGWCLYLCCVCRVGLASQLLLIASQFSPHETADLTKNQQKLCPIKNKHFEEIWRTSSNYVAQKDILFLMVESFLPLLPISDCSLVAIGCTLGLPRSARAPVHGEPGSWQLHDFIFPNQNVKNWWWFLIYIYIYIHMMCVWIESYSICFICSSI